MLGHVVIITFIIIIAGSLIPIIQYFKYATKSTQMKRQYLFSQKLFDFSLNEDFSPIEKKDNKRVILADRGWIRKPVGIVMANNDFEARKTQEYKYELP